MFQGLTRALLVCLAVAVLAATTAGAALRCVPDVALDASCDTGHATIQDAIDNAVDDDVVLVGEGSFGAFVLDKRLVLQGARTGLACDRDGAGESVVSGAGILAELVTGSAGSGILGFTFDGGTRQIESTSGPIHGVFLAANRHLNFTGSAIFLNDDGEDVFIIGNSVDGSAQTGAGSLVHLDQDDFDGLSFESNCVFDGVNGTGFFVDGTRNVGCSASRCPTFTANRITGMQANSGMNFGRFAVEDASFSSNLLAGNAFDGVQGGIANSLVIGNRFVGNGRAGLRLTGFGGTGDPTRGAFDNFVHGNCFSENGFVQTSGAGIRFDAEFAGLQASNTTSFNLIVANAVGALSASGDTIVVENNWWGDPSGPSPIGSGNAISDTGGGTLDAVPFLAVPDSGGTTLSEVCDNGFDDDCDGLTDEEDTEDCEGLAVRLTSFTAELTAEGVKLRWTTAAEMDTVGFRVLRLELRGAKAEVPEPIRQDLIPPRGTELSGAVYEITDRLFRREVAKGLMYWLEEIDADGTVSRFGPAFVSIDRKSTTSAPAASKR